MITNAQEARALTDSATLTIIQPILDKIEETARDGFYEVSVSVDESIFDDTISHLQKIGFSVQIKDPLDTTAPIESLITWTMSIGSGILKNESAIGRVIIIKW
jgi:hypothetical protein